MSLLPPSILIAAEIDGINRELVSTVRHQLARSYALVMLDDPQGVLAAWGGNATAALTRYATIHAALVALGEAGGITAPNFEVFQSQPDGTVIYVAPPEPEPEPEPFTP